MSRGKALLKYLAAFVAVVLLGLALLYLAGLMPTEQVLGGVRASAAPIALLTEHPTLLYPDNRAYALDAVSDAFMLDHALYMDTRADPKSVLSNPRYDIDPVTEDPCGSVLALADVGAAADLPAANAHYLYYWMGFRALLRPLLTQLHYAQLLELVSWLVVLAFAGALLTLFRHAAPPVALLFAVCFAAMVPVSILNSLQHACCFLLAFLGVMLVPLTGQKRRRGQGVDLPMLCFLLGAATMYFDFYTTPILTLTVPLTAAFLFRWRQDESESKSEDWKLLGRCALAWACAYVGMWVAKVLLTEAFTDYPAVSRTLAAVAGRIGLLPAPAPEGGNSYTAGQALRACVGLLVTPETKLACVALPLAWVVLLLRRRPQRAVLLRAIVLLALAALPVLWIVAVPQPTFIHARFQYRGLFGTLFALSAFGAVTVARRPEAGN